METSPCRIVIIDDNEIDRFIVKRNLAISGVTCDLIEFGIPGESLEWLESEPDHRPDLIMTDIMMPAMDGFQVIKAIREMPEMDDVPVVVLTSDANESSADKAKMLGADLYLVKPLSQAAIRQIEVMVSEGK